jgi:uncharacterized YigZ family protein
MTKPRLIPAGECRVEFKVSNSRFIATAAPTFGVDEAKDFIRKIKAKYPDATHNVPVFIIGHGASTTEHSSDDGEPSGTAGRPALAVLRGSGMGDITVVITRYFGGSKLGTGGLVKAYSDAVREVLEELPKAQKVATITTIISVSYSFFEQSKRIIEKHKGKIIDEDFGVDIMLSIQFNEENFSDFKRQIFDASNGQITTEVQFHYAIVANQFRSGASNRSPGSVFVQVHISKFSSRLGHDLRL